MSTPQLPPGMSAAECPGGLLPPRCVHATTKVGYRLSATGRKPAHSSRDQVSDRESVSGPMQFARLHGAGHRCGG